MTDGDQDRQPVQRAWREEFDGLPTLGRLDAVGKAGLADHEPPPRCRTRLGYRCGPVADRMSSMKPHHSAALETQMFVELVAKVKIAVALESGVLDLKCPCGIVILSPTPEISNLKDRQRGLMKSRIERHLRERHGDPPNPAHGLFEQTIHEVLKQAFAGN
jgi:hypothetical protein